MPGNQQMHCGVRSAQRWEERIGPRQARAGVSMRYRDVEQRPAVDAPKIWAISPGTTAAALTASHAFRTKAHTEPTERNSYGWFVPETAPHAPPTRRPICHRMTDGARAGVGCGSKAPLWRDVAWRQPPAPASADRRQFQRVRFPIAPFPAVDRLTLRGARHRVGSPSPEFSGDCRASTWSS